MASQELLKKYGEAGRERATTHFGWDAVAQATIALYRSVLR
jgi:starch synthase